MPPTRVLIAPNAFKNSLSATSAASAIERGLTQSRLDCRCRCFPVGDGGDGTGELLIRPRGGITVSASAHDPIGRPITASYGLVDEKKTAIVEMADASGLHRLALNERAPLRATSFGTGELIRHALDAGVQQVVLAVGGSASVDAGTGILRALGVRFFDAGNHELSEPGQFTRLVRIDASALAARKQPPTFTILCDVNNPLLGDHGTATVFGPQKGATPNDVRQLEAGLTRFAQLTQAQTGIDSSTIRHGGAAGGVAAGLYAWLGAKLVNGIDFLLDFTHFDQALNDADLVITGEGSIDEQTLDGKGPYGVACRAKNRHLPVIGLAGNLPLNDEQLRPYFDALLAIGNTPTDLPTAMQQTEANLIRTAYQLGNLLAISTLRPSAPAPRGNSES